MAVYQFYPKKKKNNLFEKFSNFSLTTQLIIINVFCFILFFILISTNVLTWDFIAINPSNILNGMYLWTFLTSMFMHGGFFHLFVNMLSLFFVGPLIERILGRKRFFWFYIFAGLFSGLLFVVSPYLFPQDLNTYAVGSSGALFGLIGLLVLLTPNLPVYVMFIPIPIKMKYAAPGMLVLLWVISITAGLPIGNIAHFGGLIFGLVYGWVLVKKFPIKIGRIRRHFS
jgi:membrane associated rhomboid family serine protease